MSPRILPITLLLTGYLNGVIRDYFNVCKREGMVKNAIAAYDTFLSSLSRACESWGMYFHTILCPIILKVALLPHLIYDDVCANINGYNHVLCYYDAIKDFNPRFEYSVPNSNGNEILIPGLSNEMLGHNLTGQAIKMFFCAVNPISAAQGLNLVTIQNVNIHNMFGFLYSSNDSVAIIEDYIAQLVARQKFCECIQLVGELSINQLIINQPGLTAIIQEHADLLSGVTAAVFSFLANIVNRDNPNINSIEALRKNIFGDDLKDPRIYRLTLAYKTPLDDLGRTNPLAFIDPVRPHVRENFRLLVDRVMGPRLGIRNLSLAMTYSMVPFRGALGWTSAHEFPRNFVSLGKSKKMSVDAMGNRREYYSVSVSIGGANDVVLLVANPAELHRHITDNDLTVTLPAYTIVLSNACTVTDSMVAFMTEALNMMHCVVINQDACVITHFGECPSAEANDNGFMTDSYVSEAVTLSSLKIRKSLCLSTAFETGGLISQSIVRKALPYNPSEPKVIFSGFHTTAIGAQFIDPSYLPIPFDDDDDQPARAYIGNNVVNMIDNFPFSFITFRNVFVSAPHCTIDACIEPA